MFWIIGVVWTLAILGALYYAWEGGRDGNETW
jgi:hypothetical protein